MNGPDQWTIACKRDGCNEMVTGNTEDVLAFIAAQNAKHRGEKPKEQGQTLSLKQAVAGLTWKASKWGEYAFATTVEGATTRESEVLIAAIRQANGKLELDGMVYTYNPDKPKFLNRRKVTGK